MTRPRLCGGDGRVSYPPMRDATLPVALLLACSRSPSPKLCAPLTSTRYGEGTSLHVDLRGARTIRRLGTLPKQPEDSVRCVFISDTHAHLEGLQLPMGDVLVHTGDITFCAQGGLAALEGFNEAMAKLPHTHKVVIAGNHDKRLLQLGKVEARKVLSACHYLENSGVKLCGLHFWGSPFSARHKKRSSNTAFQYSEELQRTIWRYTPNDVDVLLTHGASAPSPLLRAAIARIQPYLHAHGHEHEYHGATLLWEPWPLAEDEEPLRDDLQDAMLALPRHVLEHAARPATRRGADERGWRGGDGRQRRGGEGRGGDGRQRRGEDLRSQDGQRDEAFKAVTSKGTMQQLQPPQPQPPPQQQLLLLQQHLQQLQPARRTQRTGGAHASAATAATFATAASRPTRPALVTVNACICNKAYEPVQLPIVVDLPAKPSTVARPQWPAAARDSPPRARLGRREREEARQRYSERRTRGAARPRDRDS